MWRLTTERAELYIAPPHGCKTPRLLRPIQQEYGPWSRMSSTPYKEGERTGIDSEANKGRRRIPTLPRPAPRRHIGSPFPGRSPQDCSEGPGTPRHMAGFGAVSSRPRDLVARHERIHPVSREAQQDDAQHAVEGLFQLAIG